MKNKILALIWYPGVRLIYFSRQIFIYCKKCTDRLQIKLQKFSKLINLWNNSVEKNGLKQEVDIIHSRKIFKIQAFL